MFHQAQQVTLQDPVCLFSRDSHFHNSWNDTHSSLTELSTTAIKVKWRRLLASRFQFIAEMLPWLDHVFFLCTAIFFATILFRYCKRTATRKWHTLSIKRGRNHILSVPSYAFRMVCHEARQAKNSPLLYFSSSIFYYSLYRWKHVSKLICKNSNWGTRNCVFVSIQRFCHYLENVFGTQIHGCHVLHCFEKRFRCTFLKNFIPFR